MASQLRMWGDPAPAPPRRVSRELQLFAEELRTAIPGEQADEFARLNRSEDYVRQYEIGYEEGRRAGFDAAVQEWLKRLQHTLTVLVAAVGTYNPQLRGEPPSPELRKQWISTRDWLLRLLPVVSTVNKQGFLEAMDIVAADKVKAMKGQGLAWVRAFFALNGSPRAQGHHAGRMIGKACGDVLLSGLEEVATAGAGTVLAGTLAATRGARFADEVAPHVSRPPHDVEATVMEAIAAVEAKGPSAKVGVLGEALAEADHLRAYVRQRLGPRLAPEIEAALDSDARSILDRARALRTMSIREATHSLKAHIAERMYKQMPKFDTLKTEVQEKLAGQLKGLHVEWDGEVYFKQAARGPGNRELTDGMVVAFPVMVSRNPNTRELVRRNVVLVLAVFECKSPRVARELVIEPRAVKKEPLPWGGQFHKDFERLSEQTLVLDGKPWHPDDVGVSRRGTRWVAVLAAEQDLGRNGLSLLKQQGFDVEIFNLEVTDEELMIAAEAVVEAVR